jgi:hypothetical protein
MAEASTTKPDKTNSNTGGTITNRGVIVQGLVALLEILVPPNDSRSKPQDVPFDYVTLEPTIGGDQFDFIWAKDGEAYATQVKSSINHFQPADIKKWAEKLADERSGENCTVMLVGEMSAKGREVTEHRGVLIKHIAANLHTQDGLRVLVDLAAQRLDSVFDHHLTELKGCSAKRRVGMVHALDGEFIVNAAYSKKMTFSQFCRFLLNLHDISDDEDKPTLNAYPEVIKDLNFELRRPGKAPRLFSSCGQNLFNHDREDIQLADHLGLKKIDLLPLLTSLASNLKREDGDSKLAASVKYILGGLLVLAVDPAWILRQRKRSKLFAFDYPAQTLVKYEVEQCINLFNVVNRAHSDQICVFDEVFVKLDEHDEMKLPPLSQLGKGVLKTDDLRGKEVALIEHFSNITPKDEIEHQAYLEDTLGQINNAHVVKSRLYHTGLDTSYLPHVKDFKQDIGAAGLLISQTVSGSESSFMQNCGNFVSPLHTIRVELLRMCGLSPT